MSAEVLLEQARKLSVADRLHLVEELWDSIAREQDDLPVTIEQREELDRRLADLAAHPDDGSPWADVRARLERKL